LNGNWKQASAHFFQAKEMAEKLGLPLKHRLKLSAVLLLLKFAPGLLKKMMDKARPEEAAFLPDKI
jgi:hypothetical protein